MKHARKMAMKRRCKMQDVFMSVNQSNERRAAKAEVDGNRKGRYLESRTPCVLALAKRGATTGQDLPRIIVREEKLR